MLRLRALSVAALLVCTACTNARPSMEGWTACVFDHAEHDMLHGDTVPKPAAGSFVYVYTTWQLHAFEAQGRMSELEIDFPVALTAGVTRSFSREHEQTADYRERYGFLGSPTLIAKTLTGTVRVLASDARSASIAVDLTALDLAIDDDKLGPVALKGTVVARKVTSMQECRAR